MIGGRSLLLLHASSKFAVAVRREEEYGSGQQRCWCAGWEQRRQQKGWKYNPWLRRCSKDIGDKIGTLALILARPWDGFDYS